MTRRVGLPGQRCCRAESSRAKPRARRSAGTALLKSDQSGATMVEFAVAVPVLILLIVGLIEFGFGFLDSQAVAGATREGARVGSIFGTDPNADDLILAAVGDSLGDMRGGSELQQVWIFRSNEAGDVVDETNTTNKYVPDGAGGWVCLDAAACPWDPATRNTDLSGSIGVVSRDYLGVRVLFDHEWLTGFLPFPAPTWTDDTVMLLEPLVETP